MEVNRVLNNNAVMVTRDDGSLAIVLGRAIGYGRRPGDEVDASRVTDVFTPDTSTSIEWLTAFLTDVDLGVVRVAGEIADLAHQVLDVRVSQSLILPLADHLAFALERRSQDLAVDFPLRWEVRQLYPRELAVARQGLVLVSRRLGVELPAEEASAIAMHLVGAQLGRGDGLASTVEMTRRITQVLEVVGAVMGVEVDQDSMSTARFVTHLRYLFIRMEQRSVVDDAPIEVLRAVADAQPEAYRCAQRLRTLLDIGGQCLTEDEVLYLTLHVARLARDSRATGS